VAKYKVMLTTVASFTIDVDANDSEEAIEKAQDEAPREVCGQCSGWGTPWSLELNEVWELHQPEVEKIGESA
jgi:hypothetical protein